MSLITRTFDAFVTRNKETLNYSAPRGIITPDINQASYYMSEEKALAKCLTRYEEVVPVTITQVIDQSIKEKH